MGRATFASLIVDFYLELVPSDPDLLDPDLSYDRSADIVTALPAETRACSRCAIRRRWKRCSIISRAGGRPCRASSPGGGDPPSSAGASRFFEVTHDEGALTRFALEARLSAMVFGAEPPRPCWRGSRPWSA